jgi:hypothetical protein
LLDDPEKARAPTARSDERWCSGPGDLVPYGAHHLTASGPDASELGVMIRVAHVNVSSLGRAVDPSGA